jgi:Ca2+-transporting ATPase
VVVGLTVTVFVAGLLGGRELSEIFITSVALAVSAIPEGLLVALTVILAIGMQRILKQRGLVRNLVSAETLGGVTTICVDKTGTLTYGKQKVVKLVGDRKLMAKQALLSSDHDDPIIVAAEQWAEHELSSKDLKGERIDDYLLKHVRLDSLPFSSKDRFAATLHKWNNSQNFIFVSGAPDFLMDWCGLSRSEKKDILEVIEKLTTDGMRLLGMARKKVKPSLTKLTKKDVTAGLEWVGILALEDPVREGVRGAFELSEKAGVRPIVITGDYPQTALAVIKKLDLPISKENVILGDELEGIGEDKLMKTLLTHTPMLFARTTPEQKLKIVSALKLNGEVVAMTGDGVNDAPALSKADIGIAVAEASDVSKESADLVLLDSSFNTIITSIEEGRGIFDNIRKVILYLLSDAFSEIFAVLAAILLGFPLPVTATQILWINLVSDGFPNLALTVDPKRAHAMDEPPRIPTEPLVNRWMLILIAFVSFFSGLTAFGLFWFVHHTTGDIKLARSVAFAALGINSLAYVFSVRALREPVWRVNPLSNLWLIGGIAGGAFLQILPFVFAPARAFFNV